VEGRSPGGISERASRSREAEGHCLCAIPFCVGMRGSLGKKGSDNE
jgi:hypothetical protein